MNDPADNRWREECWRGKMTAAKRRELKAWLHSHPDSKAAIEVELSLNQALGTLKNVPVSNNFTARLLESAKRESAKTERSNRRRPTVWWESLPAWLPRLGVGAAVAVAGLFSYQQFQISQRQKMLDSVTAVAEVAVLPTPEILRDYESIKAMSRTPGADEVLLAVMSK